LILDDIAESRKEMKQAVTRQPPGKMAVTHLSHMKRQVPVTLLATYPNGTADLEIAPSFMELWAEHPQRKYSLPGVLQKHPSQTAPPGKSDPKDKPPVYRAILKMVPIRYLTSVHSAGFYIYDAKYRTIDDYKMDAVMNRGFNPRDGQKEPWEKVQDFSIAAGPLPADASPAACQYEWRFFSLHYLMPFAIAGLVIAHIALLQRWF
jgi:hypothetical protein